MAKFRKKPVVIEAITFIELCHLVANADGYDRNGAPWRFNYGKHSITRLDLDTFVIPTLEGEMRMGRDDMLITGVKGEIYPCKRDIFDATYEPAEPWQGRI